MPTASQRSRSVRAFQDRAETMDCPATAMPRPKPAAISRLCVFKRNRLEVNVSRIDLEGVPSNKHVTMPRKVVKNLLSNLGMFLQMQTRTAAGIARCRIRQGPSVRTARYPSRRSQPSPVRLPAELVERRRRNLSSNAALAFLRRKLFAHRGDSFGVVGLEERNRITTRDG